MIAYSNLPTKVDPILGAFIPFDAKITDLEISRRLIRRQNQYIAHHHNIPLNGLDETILQYIIPNDNDLANEIQLKAQVFRIDPSASIDHLGRHNLSTTADYYKHAIEWLDVELPKVLELIPEDKRGKFEGCIERVVARVRSSKSATSSNSGQSSVKSYLSVLISFYGADDSDDDQPPQVFRNKKTAPQLTFDFDDTSNFPGLPLKISASAPPRKTKSPTPSTKSASSSITMSEFDAVRREMQAKFESDLKEFKDKLIAKIEHDIADTVKSSVATAMEGMNATINTSLQDNNKIVYANMQAERTTITDTMTAAVSKKMDLSIGIAVTRPTLGSQNTGNPLALKALQERSESVAPFQVKPQPKTTSRCRTEIRSVNPHAAPRPFDPRAWSSLRGIPARGVDSSTPHPLVSPRPTLRGRTIYSPCHSAALGILSYPPLRLRSTRNSHPVCSQV
jgi:hypothetical protein